MYRNFYSINDMPKPIQHEEKPPKPTLPKNCDSPPVPPKKDKGFLQNLQLDDIILIAVVLILLADGCDDNLLILAIAFIFISGF